MGYAAARSRRRSPLLRSRRATCWGLLLLGLGACTDGDPDPALAPRRLHVVWITIDALRADHLGFHGYGRATSPFLDELARDAVVFENAISQESYTQASVPSYLTSTYPRQHGVLYDQPQIDVLAPEFLTLAEVLRAEGWTTAAFVFNPHLRERFGFAQGFDLYDDNDEGWPEEGPQHERMETARKIHRKLEAFLADARRGPLFLYLHYRDVHDPYTPPPPYHETFLPAGFVLDPDRLRGRRFPPEDAPLRITQYDGEILYTSDRLRETLALLAQAGLRRGNTLFVVTADHGEEFYDPHPDDPGGTSHGRTLHLEQIHVPLVLALPGLAPRREAAFVELTDVTPSVLDAVGIEPRRFAAFQGQSLLPLARGRASARPFVYSGGSHGRATIIADGWKLDRQSPAIRARRNAAFERAPEQHALSEALYHLPTDPGERRNRIAEAPEVAARLRALLDAKEAALARGSAAAVELDPETRERLRALGYL